MMVQNLCTKKKKSIQRMIVQSFKLVKLNQISISRNSKLFNFADGTE